MSGRKVGMAVGTVPMTDFYDEIAASLDQAKSAAGMGGRKQVWSTSGNAEWRRQQGLNGQNPQPASQPVNAQPTFFPAVNQMFPQQNQFSNVQGQNALPFNSGGYGGNQNLFSRGNPQNPLGTGNPALDLLSRWPMQTNQWSPYMGY